MIPHGFEQIDCQNKNPDWIRQFIIIQNLSKIAQIWHKSNRNGVAEIAEMNS